MAPIPLREYLSGLVYARADGIFQATLDPIVKNAMQDHFAEDPASEYSQYVAAQVERASVRATPRTTLRPCAFLCHFVAMQAEAAADRATQRALDSGKIRKEIEDTPSTAEAKEKVSVVTSRRTHGEATPQRFVLRSSGSCGRSTG